MVRVVPTETVAAHEVLRAVRKSFVELPDGLVMVACSGGPDSLALAAATADVVSASGRLAGAVVVDHMLQDGSAEVAENAAQQCSRVGLSPVTVVRVRVDRGTEGPEAAARSARYEALETRAQRLGAVAVLLGHSLDDQAESVLLGLARGSGTRSLAGMRRRRGLYVRPLLGVRRDTLREACQHWGLRPWSDPHNSDHAYTRVRVREEVVPMLESQLGPGVVSALARTARIARADSDALDQWAADELERSLAQASEQTGDRCVPTGAAGLDVSHLARLPFAIRTRVLRSWLVAQGCPGSRLTAEHVWSVARLVDHWRGQGQLSMPGGIAVWRECDTLLIGTDGPFSALRGKRGISALHGNLGISALHGNLGIFSPRGSLGALSEDESGGSAGVSGQSEHKTDRSERNIGESEEL